MRAAQKAGLNQDLWNPFGAALAVWSSSQEPMRAVEPADVMFVREKHSRSFYEKLRQKNPKKTKNNNLHELFF